MMVLAATAIPVELRAPHYEPWSFGSFVSLTSDVLANVLGYVPVGIVLRDLGLLRAVAMAAAITMCAETAQLMMMHRDPSLVDVVANVVGAVLGVAIGSRWEICIPTLAVRRGASSIAMLLAVMIGVGVWATSGDALNTRGVTAPGRLEAYWKMDESSGRVAEDASGHGLNGRFSREPNRVMGVVGRAVRFDGTKDYIDFGHSTALRLTGSMTISAWINSMSFPIDDAAIVSSHKNSNTIAGYQLDTTVDTGPRTIGFKIGDECGRLTARYGATPLRVGAWYHIAGVYDAEAHTLNVYLNGAPDDGVLHGSVTNAQHSSRSHVYIGTRSDSKGFEFAGLIDEVRIYSRALTAAEIVADMQNLVVDGLATEAVPGGVEPRRRGTAARHGHAHAPCAVSSDREDAAAIPIAAAGVGLLVAVACVGLWPSIGWLPCLLVSLVPGLLLLPFTAATLPVLNLWLIPLTSLAGGASVVVSVRRRNDPDNLPL
jgi:hypothetical protein